MSRRYLSRFVILFVLFQGVAASGVAAAAESVTPVLSRSRQYLSTEAKEHLEGRMATVSTVMALLALGVVTFTLVWCNRLSESVARLRAAVSDADGRKRLAELTNELQSLRAHADRLRQNWQADTTRLESVIRQLETRVAAMEQTHNSLRTVSGDLESLRAFRTQVEQIHVRIQKAFNGAIPGMSSDVPRDEKSPRVDA